MTQRLKIKASISTLIAASFLAVGMAGCKAPPALDTAQTSTAKTASETPSNTKLPPIRKALSCLPNGAAMIAAHRGTDERWKDIAENSIGGLKALIDHGTLMAEIDVAGLRDNTLITFHDGVWDKISTGKGPIAASRQSDLENILLKSRAGGLTADRPPRFADMLNAAKGKIYMEVDFKSSADPKDVIDAIRGADMADQVLLIAYNAGQAAELKRLAPEMLRSNPKDATENTHAVWLGYDVGNGNTAKRFKDSGNFIIGRIGDPNRQPPLKVLRSAADILVTDQAERYDGIIGLNNTSRGAYEVCLSE
jgi:glycerophosphoryl diester phosphodiesterase